MAEQVGACPAPKSTLLQQRYLFGFAVPDLDEADARSQRRTPYYEDRGPYLAFEQQAAHNVENPHRLARGAFDDDIAVEV